MSYVAKTISTGQGPCVSSSIRAMDQLGPKASKQRGAPFLREARGGGERSVPRSYARLCAPKKARNSESPWMEWLSVRKFCGGMLRYGLRRLDMGMEVLLLSYRHILLEQNPRVLWSPSRESGRCQWRSHRRILHLSGQQQGQELRVSDVWLGRRIISIFVRHRTL